ncbi:helix-turn-helix transcriptional regulator [Vibrio splendidus]|uniref:helix-turn-helix transcriptional regulator n=1 Tax=Vibrio TaxID=662 RepID=UPI000C855F8A|nr:MULTISPECIES: AlpA family phage regulatory protein [Vibrio]
MVEVIPLSEALISISEMTKLVNRNRQTLWSWWNTGKFPSPILQNGKTLGWRESDYIEWLRRNQAQVSVERQVRKAC